MHSRVYMFSIAVIVLVFIVTHQRINLACHPNMAYASGKYSPTSQPMHSFNGRGGGGGGGANSHA